MISCRPVDKKEIISVLDETGTVKEARRIQELTHLELSEEQKDYIWWRLQ